MTDAPPPLDTARIIATFDHYQVDYILVGGVAARVYGAARLTEDFDCLARRTRENLACVARALADLGARLRVEGLTDIEAKALPVRLEPETLGAMELSTWRTDAGDVDILTELPARDGTRRRYDDLAEHAVTIRIDGVHVRVAGLDDIIDSKRWANRPKDHDALPELETLAAQGRDYREPCDDVGDAPELA